MKKRILFAAVIAVMVCSMPTAAFAHSGSRGHSRNTQQAATASRHEFCSMAGCEETGVHQHDSAWYCSLGERQGDYPECTFDNCNLTGVHEHNGELYHCAYRSDRTGCARR